MVKGEIDMTPEIGTEASEIGKRVYLDVCALNRPLDDQNQMRIRLEADAVQLILSHVSSRTLTLIISPCFANSDGSVSGSGSGLRLLIARKKS
jgi:hypothetical protein